METGDRKDRVNSTHRRSPSRPSFAASDQRFLDSASPGLRLANSSARRISSWRDAGCSLGPNLASAKARSRKGPEQVLGSPASTMSYRGCRLSLTRASASSGGVAAARSPSLESDSSDSASSAPESAVAASRESSEALQSASARAVARSRRSPASLPTAAKRRRNFCAYGVGPHTSLGLHSCSAAARTASLAAQADADVRPGKRARICAARTLSFSAIAAR
mmetsp:Transcript_10667/g.41412  ORF Transcript_10667/g.41412 Transcript_10667/m.41412 type:complete len:221 (+) Transcript_10667:544-1206(+)